MQVEQGQVFPEQLAGVLSGNGGDRGPPDEEGEVDGMETDVESNGDNGQGEDDGDDAQPTSTSSPSLLSLVTGALVAAPHVIALAT